MNESAEIKKNNFCVQIIFVANAQACQLCQFVNLMCDTLSDSMCQYRLRRAVTECLSDSHIPVLQVMTVYYSSVMKIIGN